MLEALAATPKRRASRKIFISYSHKDKKWLDELLKHLAPMKGAFETWSDEKIQPGTKWRDELQNALDSAQVGVLLVTPNFLASDFIEKNELPPLVRGTKVLWIAVDYSGYRETPIASFQALNDPGKPLLSLKGATRSKALVAICEKIKKAVVG